MKSRENEERNMIYIFFGEFRRGLQLLIRTSMIHWSIERLFPFSQISYLNIFMLTQGIYTDIETVR